MVKKKKKKKKKTTDFTLSAEQRAEDWRKLAARTLALKVGGNCETSSFVRIVIVLSFVDCYLRILSLYLVLLDSWLLGLDYFSHIEGISHINVGETKEQSIFYTVYSSPCHIPSSVYRFTLEIAEKHNANHVPSRVAMTTITIITHPLLRS